MVLSRVFEEVLDKVRKNFACLLLEEASLWLHAAVLVQVLDAGGGEINRIVTRFKAGPVMQYLCVSGGCFQRDHNRLLFNALT